MSAQVVDISDTTPEKDPNPTARGTTFAPFVDPLEELSMTTPVDPHCIHGDVCSCPAKPANRPEAGDAPANEGWEGWATTTQFGCGDGAPWGNAPNDVGITKLNDPTAPRMGAAVPWRFYYKWYGSKTNQTEMVAESIQGKVDVNACFLAQPISKYPDQISGQTDGLGEFCDKDCTDINSADIAAKDEDGKPYPAYLIVPFEGCGGDCKPVGGKPVPDCANTCFGKSGQGVRKELNGDFSEAPAYAPYCDAMNILWDDGKWDWNEQIKTAFLEKSQPFGVAPDTGYGRNVHKRSNWCSGQNMHFDMGMDNPYWVKLGMGNIAQTNAPSNIIMRYKRVRCDIWGTFEARGGPLHGEGETCETLGDCKTGLTCCWYKCKVKGEPVNDTGICTFK